MKKSIMNKLSIIFCVILLVSCGSQKKNEINKMAQFEQRIDSLRIKYNIPGISIGISNKDSIQLIKGFG